MGCNHNSRATKDASNPAGFSPKHPTDGFNHLAFFFLIFQDSELSRDPSETTNSKKYFIYFSHARNKY